KKHQKVNPFALHRRHCRQTARRQEPRMRSLFIRYQAKPDRAAENRALITDVFAELAVVQPAQLRYAVFDFEDGTFVHYATVPADPEANPLRQLASFQRFQTDNGARQVAPPSV